MPDPLTRPQDWPLYWFARLERAAEEGDFGVAADATRQLRRLGVEVRYRRPSHRRRRGGPRA